jgi:hypothetical protein
MFLLNVLIMVSTIVISVYTIQWIDHLAEIKCKCSEDFKRDFIKYFLYVLIGYLVFTVIFASNNINLFAGMQQNIVTKALSYFINAINFLMPYVIVVNIILSIIYITRLKQINCKCSEDTRREVYYYAVIIFLAFIFLQILFFVVYATWLYYKFDYFYLTIFGMRFHIKK